MVRDCNLLYHVLYPVNPTSYSLVLRSQRKHGERSHSENIAFLVLLSYTAICLFSILGRKNVCPFTFQVSPFQMMYLGSFPGQLKYIPGNRYVKNPPVLAGYDPFIFPSHVRCHGSGGLQTTLVLQRLNKGKLLLAKQLPDSQSPTVHYMTFHVIRS